MAGLRNGLRRVAVLQDHWAGIPMPLSGERLVVEPKYPKAKELSAMYGEPDQVPGLEDISHAKIRNQFWSDSRKCDIIIFENNAGKIQWGVRPGIHHFSLDLHTLGCCDAWGIEQESNAVHTLASLVTHRQFKQYLQTGMFLESSKRSGLVYMFRRLRPTVAMTGRPRFRWRTMESRDLGMTILAALCLHPIAFYSGTYAGAMCPTDDVIAHLMLMRGDEAMFWRRANQHEPHRPEAGL